MMKNAIMETSFRVPFIYLVEQIFLSTLSSSICVAQMSGNIMYVKEGKKDQNLHSWPRIVI